MVFLHQSTLCKVIQATSLWRVLYQRRAKSLSRKPRNEGGKRPFCDILEVLPRFITERKAQADIIAE